MTSRAQSLDAGHLVGYRKPDPNTQPEYNYPPYASTVRRSPSQPLVVLPTTLSEITGPLFGWDRLQFPPGSRQECGLRQRLPDRRHRHPGDRNRHRPGRSGFQQ